MKPKTILAVMLGLVSIVIMLQNTQIVTLRLLFWTVSVSRILLLPLLVAVGFVIGYIVSLVTTKPKKESGADVNVKKDN